MTKYPEYCAVIRTLGTAGEKFEQEIDSLLAQNHRPAKILAYIPHGYDIPQFANSDKVEFVRTDKGMVTQRSQPFDEVTTPYILFLDDDVYLAPDSVTKLFDAIADFDADCIAPNVFPNHLMKGAEKFMSSLLGAWPHFDKEYAFRIKKSCAYKYTTVPSPVMLTESNAGTCALCKVEVPKTIHFEDERWIDAVGYPEDQAFFYKMHISGFRLLTHYESGIIHLDAGTNKIGAKKAESQIKSMRTQYLIWLRTSYQLQSGRAGRIKTCISYYNQQFLALLGDFMLGVYRRKPYYFTSRIKGYFQGRKLAKSEMFRQLKPFDAYHKQ